MMIVEWFVLRAARGARSTKNFGGIREVKITAQKSMQLPSRNVRYKRRDEQLVTRRCSRTLRPRKTVPFASLVCRFRPQQ